MQIRLYLRAASLAATFRSQYPRSQPKGHAQWNPDYCIWGRRPCWAPDPFVRCYAAGTYRPRVLSAGRQCARCSMRTLLLARSGWASSSCGPLFRSISGNFGPFATAPPCARCFPCRRRRARMQGAAHCAALEVRLARVRRSAFFNRLRI